jgi:DNA mismatch repair protein MutL
MSDTSHSPESPKRHILRLPADLVNRIAAGEVVERPAAVVKELVENALDAGATKIELQVSQGGRTLRLADNGIGIAPEQLPLAFENHATSKLNLPEELEHIATLGFRGEALASISAVARVTCITRQAGQESGYRYSVNGGIASAVEPEGCAHGTIMEVDDLFFNTPARLKFLKRPATEMAHVEETLQGLALSHPHVRFHVTLNGKVALQTQGSGQLSQTVAEVFNLPASELRLFNVNATDTQEGLVLQAVVAEPTASSLLLKSKAKARWFLLNQRLIRCHVLSKAVDTAFESLMEEGAYPLCVVHLTVPPALVDVNVHPTKREIRHAKPNLLFGFIRSHLRQALEQRYHKQWHAPVEEASTLPISLNPESLFNPPLPPQADAPVSSGVYSSYAPRPQTLYGAVPTQLALSAYAPPAASSFQYEPNDAALQTPALFLDDTVRPAGSWRVLGQLYYTYVLLETRQGLMIVDQHIASERYCYEALKHAVTSQEPQVQTLLGVEPLALSPVQLALLAEHRESLEALGFRYQLQTLGESEAQATHVLLTGIPLLYPERKQLSPLQQLYHMLETLEAGGNAEPDRELLLATLACHTAVRAGETLNHEQMERMVKDWLACSLPWSCPHGRPIAHTLEVSQLNQFFHRPSLPVNAGV